MDKGEIDFQKFLSGESKIAINCQTEIEADLLFKILYNMGIKWINDDELTETYWLRYNKNTCYFYENNAYNLGVVFGDINYAKSAKYQITNLYSMLNRIIPSS